MLCRQDGTTTVRRAVLCRDSIWLCPLARPCDWILPLVWGYGSFSHASPSLAFVCGVMFGCLPLVLILISIQAVEKSPFLEKLNKKGLEVLYLTEPIDEMTMQSIMDFEDKK